MPSRIALGDGSRRLALSALIAVIGCLVIAALSGWQWPENNGRSHALSRTLLGLEQTGTPLVGLTDGTPAYDRVSGSDGLYRAEVGDDPGSYLYVPFLTRLVGSDDVIDGLTLLVMLAIGLGVVINSIVFRRLFDSSVAAIIAPIALVLAFIFFAGLGGIYLTTAWAILVLMPPLLLLMQRWPRHGLLILLAIAVAASFASSIRGQAGLPVAIAAVGLVATRDWTPRRRLAIGALVLLAYVSVTPLGIGAVKSHRDGELSATATESTGGHVLWHNLYLGLGFLPNEEEIRWDDALAARAAQREDPTVEYLSPEHEQALRDLTFDFAEEHPGTAAETTARKAVAAIFLSPVLLALALVGLVVMGSTEAGRAIRRRSPWMLAPAAILGLAVATLVVPNREFAGSWIGALTLIVILAVVTAAVALERGETRLLLRRPPRRLVAMGGLAAAFIVVGLLLTDSTREECLGWQEPKPEGVEGYYTGCESALYPLPISN